MKTYSRNATADQPGGSGGHGTPSKAPRERQRVTETCPGVPGTTEGCAIEAWPTSAGYRTGSNAVGDTSTRRGHDFSQVAVHSRAAADTRCQLRVNAPGDASEREADRVADEMLYRPGGRRPFLPAARTQSELPGETPAPPMVNRVLRSPGQQLDAHARAFFEPRFGRSFHDVRIHADGLAHRSAQAMHAQAYTVGSNIVYGRGMEVDTLRGMHLLAHELAHVVQQDSGPAGQHLRVQRQDHSQQRGWLPELDEILPRHGGLVLQMSRVTTLIDIFGTQLLEQHVLLIHGDAAATRFTREHGIPGIVALYDTRRGARLDVAKAGRALSEMPDRYRRDALASLRLQASPEPAPSFWFHDPASQQTESGSGELTTTHQQRAQVHVEHQLSQVGGDLFVRFAYPATDVSHSGSSGRVENAKRAILQAIAQVVADLDSLPPASSRAERSEQETVRARLHETLRGLGRSSPLNIFIATEPSARELLSGPVAAFTDRVFVNLHDVGDPARLQAAVRVPLLMLQGGAVPTRRGIQQVPAISSADLQRTMLHEGLHAMLIRQSIDSDTVWQASRSQLNVQGSPSAVPKFVELAHKYVIAQEEVFAYENEASLYPPLSPEKARYDTFIAYVGRFLRRRHLTLSTVSHPIHVEQRVAGHAVTWTIRYQIPSGTVDLTVGDIQTIDLLLGTYPLN